MRKFNGIIESDVAPLDANLLWIKGKHAYHCHNGLWVAIGENDTDIELLTNMVELHIANDMPIDITLKEGITEEIKEYNLTALGNSELLAHAKLVGGLGYGSVYWVPNSGGLMSVVNPAGSTTWYNITTDGAISKIVDSYDIYKYYAEYFLNYTAGALAIDNETFIKLILKKLFDRKGGTKQLRPSNPELGLTYYLTNVGLIIWNGTAWVDCMDNMPVD